MKQLTYKEIEIRLFTLKMSGKNIWNPEFLSLIKQRAMMEKRMMINE